MINIRQLILALNAGIDRPDAASYKNTGGGISMKNMLIILFFFFVIQSPAFAQSKGTGTDVGRFQLFQGTYRFVNIMGEEYLRDALFKLDTKTGQLFICEEWQIDGKEGYVNQRKCKPFGDEKVTLKDVNRE